MPPSPTTDQDDLRINAATTMGPVTLRVADLDTMTSYYSNAFAMNLLDEHVEAREFHRTLGHGATPLVKLVHMPDLPAARPGEAGLFHTAFLFSDKPSLAETVYRALADERSRFIGASDHLVSEAFYFTDPEGNGVELYADRPRDRWAHESGQIQMDTTPLSVRGFLSQHLDQVAFGSRAIGSTVVGHVHLQVGDIPTARRFYVEALGFEITSSSHPGALFASAGGYHHHVAMNTWRSAGAGPRAAKLGLGEMAIVVPTDEDLEKLHNRLKRQGYDSSKDSFRVLTRDPWGTQISIARV